MARSKFSDEWCSNLPDGMLAVHMAAQGSGNEELLAVLCNDGAQLQLKEVRIIYNCLYMPSGREDVSMMHCLKLLHQKTLGSMTCAS